MLSAADAESSLRVENGSLVFDSEDLSRPDRGSWRLERIDEETTFLRILDAHDSSRGLAVQPANAEHVDDLELVLGPALASDAAALWRITMECVADARSIHLRYPAPSAVTLFYNEVHPVAAPPGTYFCTSGFGSDSRGPAPCGYAGVQRLADGSWIIIFSVWHRMADAEAPAVDARAIPVAVSPDAYGTEFSGEGSGSSIRMPVVWATGSAEPVRFVVTAEPLADDTVLSAYIARGTEPWTSLGAILRESTGGRLMSSFYSFIEDFAHTGNTAGTPAAGRSPYRLRSALFADPWVGVSKPFVGLHPVTRATVTAYSPHPLENLTAQVSSGSADFGVLVTTGANPVDQAAPLGTVITDPLPGKRVRPNLDGIPYL